MRARRAAGAIVISVELSPVGVEAPVRCGLLDIARRSQASAVREAFRIFVEREFAKVTKSLDSSDRDLTRDESCNVPISLAFPDVRVRRF